MLETRKAEVLKRFAWLRSLYPQPGIVHEGTFDAYWQCLRSHSFEAVCMAIARGPKISPKWMPSAGELLAAAEMAEIELARGAARKNCIAPPALAPERDAEPRTETGREVEQMVMAFAAKHTGPEAAARVLALVGELI